MNLNSWLPYSLPGKSHKLLQQNILCHFYISILHEGVVYKCGFWLRTKGEKQVGCGPNPAHKRRRNAVKPVSCWSIDTSKIQVFSFPLQRICWCGNKHKLYSSKISCKPSMRIYWLYDIELKNMRRGSVTIFVLNTIVENMWELEHVCAATVAFNSYLVFSCEARTRCSSNEEMDSRLYRFGGLPVQSCCL